METFVQGLITEWKGCMLTPMTTMRLLTCPRLWAFVVTYEDTPRSRFRFGSPCRFVRAIDLAVHVLLPEVLLNRLPVLACYLRTTSPRWGRAWRTW